MSIIKCKMCGGDIEFTPGATYGTCEYCGSTSTIPKADDENKLNRYNRANHFRRQCEFDKAVAAYEKLLEQDDTDAEAHWGAVLSRYGIEYVEDPATKKRIPTCHRVQMASILADADYKAAVEHAPDAESRRLYEDQAAQIAEIQKGILAVSANEKPYDVFICYKETDEIGQRTHDSQWAQDVYYGLTEQGYKVFFARITLEDKLGQQYEPYIFAALNSAKVMVVIGSKPEYFNAVWVKNEWSRYLALMAKDRTRLLIPCYRGMDPYDLPEELSNLQSQDMSKIGFMQDLIRGISKVLTTEKPQQATPAAAPAGVAVPVSTAAPLLRRAFMFLEDGDWEKADEFCEQVLNLEPENAEAYLGKLMAELKVGKREKLPDQPQPFHKSSNYAKACRFSDTLAAELKGCTEHIIRRNEEARVAGIYDRACQTKRNARYEEDFEKAIKLFQSIIKHRDSQSMIQQCHEGVMNCRYQAACQQKASASSEAAYKAASQLFANLGQYKDAAAQAAECLELAEASRKDDIYQTASYKMSNTSDQNSWAYAEKLFKSIPGWKDADEKAIECENKIAELKAQDEARRQEKERQEQLAREKAAKEAKLKKTIAIVTPIIAGLIAAVYFLVTTVIIPDLKYNAAMALKDEGRYEEAILVFEEIETHKDSTVHMTECKYYAALNAGEQGQYGVAIAGFAELGKYNDSEQRIKYYEIRASEDTVLTSTDFNAYDAVAARYSAMGDYLDCPDRAAMLTDSANAIREDKYNKAISDAEQGQYDTAFIIFNELGSYKDSSQRVKYYALRKAEIMQAYSTDAAAIDGIASGYVLLGDYLDCPERAVVLTARAEKVRADKYSSALAAAEQGQYDTAISIFNELGSYKDSSQRVTYYTLRKTEIMQANSGDITIWESIAAAYAAMGNYLDCPERAAAMLSKKDTHLEEKYNTAVTLAKAGKYYEAYIVFVELGGYKDSEAQANALLKAHPVIQYNLAEVGDYITFGAYEQDANTSNGKEPIEWLVLAKENDRLLVISRYALDYKPYNEKNTSVTSVTWETCTLRKWLNNDFLNAAFSSTEKAMIPTVTVSADKNPIYSTNPGNATQDKVFLLSIPEADKYCTSGSARQCKPTAYAKTQGAYQDNSGLCSWWLRSPGVSQRDAAYVITHYGVYNFGLSVNRDSVAVRPAMWINLEP